MTWSSNVARQNKPLMALGKFRGEKCKAVDFCHEVSYHDCHYTPATWRRMWLCIVFADNGSASNLALCALTTRSALFQHCPTAQTRTQKQPTQLPRVPMSHVRTRNRTPTCANVSEAEATLEVLAVLFYSNPLTNAPRGQNSLPWRGC